MDTQAPFMRISCIFQVWKHCWTKIKRLFTRNGQFAHSSHSRVVRVS